MNASLIIMDEPTTSLTDPEIQRVFAMLRTLKAQGVGIVFISHKLREVMELCDRYAVLRDGVMVAEGAVADTTVSQLARHMVGHEVTEMIQGYVTAITMEATEEDIHGIVYPHPTMSEAMHEAALDAYGRVIHI